ncbi:restriction endonuclease [Levilactobacillus acidifarinae]|uniref:Mrr restriction system protein n=1 Tax=Levilactobacillus acidifarinae DSM 19394 = JCM 15949 TaxID=1423715 RepID=A0A0R1LIN8_9LACO|nr:restriction endonuclease [Levilactobacillus acidifarinae]KRK95621.1 Mrr restriction system protein [Levilactobacillus acidifarinae DSM 19394]GEO69356.1 mrr restriction system protein [Levilactobacillus acidifarinae]
MDYRKLKLGKNGLPTWDALIPIILKFANQQEEWRGKALRVAVADDLQLPTDLRQLEYTTYHDNIIENRVSWALSELTTAGILRRVRRGYYQITDLGKQLLTKSDTVDFRMVHQLPKYQQHQQEIKERQLRGTSATNVEDLEPEVTSAESITHILKAKTQAYNDEIAAELLQRIRESNPSFFEELVVKLLVAMGYQGANGAAWVTQQSNDNGIDGVINQDALGTRTVYIQAKRYQESNVVQRPEIDSFYGALNRQHADRGVFMTTSKFSDGAVQAAKSDAIVLVDGIQLTTLMLQYQVGVQLKQKYVLFEIDEDFFDEG